MGIKECESMKFLIFDKFTYLRKDQIISASLVPSSIENCWEIRIILTSGTGYFSNTYESHAKCARDFHSLINMLDN